MRISLLAVTCVAACGTTTSVSTGFVALRAPRPAIAANRVELVFSGRVDRPYVELGVAAIAIGPGVISFGSPVPPPTPSAVLDTLRALGASNGCDALLVNPTAFAGAAQHVSATCIAYR
jgi:hypothetical protein